jgi:hypothetical protein
MRETAHMISHLFQMLEKNYVEALWGEMLQRLFIALWGELIQWLFIAL